MTQDQQGDTSVLTQLFAHNAWANLKLLDFCRNLSDEQLDSTATGGYGSIRDTVRHIIGSEVSYVERVNGKSPAQPIPRQEFAGFEVLTAGVRWTGGELLELALSARADTLVRQRSPGRNSEYPLAALMVQAITHSCEHRTQISTIITQLGIEPPDLSTWSYMGETGILHDLGAETSGA